MIINIILIPVITFLICLPVQAKTVLPHSRNKLELKQKVTASQNNLSNLKSAKNTLKMYLKDDKNTEALQAVDRILLNSLSDAELSTLIAKVFLKTNQPENAEFFAKRAIEFDKYYPYGYIILGNVYVKLSQTDSHLNEQKFLLSEAYRNYNTAFKLNKNIPEPLLGYAQIAIVKEDFDKALNYLHMAHNIDIKHTDTLKALAELYNSRKDYELSIKYYKKYISAKNKINSSTYMELGKIYEKLGNINQAKAYYLLVYNDNPLYPEVERRLINLEHL